MDTSLTASANSELSHALPHGADAPEAERDTWQAVRRGFQRLCPNCGKGHMFKTYLKVNDHCPVCREELSHHRADDGPAYLTILIVAHILGFAMHFAWSWFRPDPWVMATIFTIGTVALSLFLLPRLKGVIVAVQWAKHMHGFGTPRAADISAKTSDQV